MSVFVLDSFAFGRSLIQCDFIVSVILSIHVANASETEKSRHSSATHPDR